MGPLKNTKSSYLFSESKELSPKCVLDRGGTSKTIAFNVASQIKSFEERHRPELLSKTDWLIEQ